MSLGFKRLSAINQLIVPVYIIFLPVITNIWTLLFHATFQQAVNWQSTDIPGSGYTATHNICVTPGSTCNPLIPITHSPYSTVLLEKPTLPQLIKQFPTSHATQKFPAMFTAPSHLSLSWTRSNQSTSIHPISKATLILSSHLLLGLLSGSFPKVQASTM